MRRTVKDFTADIFEESAKAIKTIGLERTLNALRQAQSPIQDQEGPVIKIIFEVVCKELHISRAGLDGTAHGHRVDALTYIVILLEKYLGYNMEQVRSCFKTPRSRSRLCQYKQDFNLLDPKHPTDSEKINAFDKIERKVERNIKSIKYGT